MVTVDASVWVAADANDELACKDSRAFLGRLLTEGSPVHQPTLTLVEVCAGAEPISHTKGLGKAPRSVPRGDEASEDLSGGREVKPEL